MLMLACASTAVQLSVLQGENRLDCLLVSLFGSNMHALGVVIAAA